MILTQEVVIASQRIFSCLHITLEVVLLNWFCQVNDVVVITLQVRFRSRSRTCSRSNIYFELIAITQTQLNTGDLNSRVFTVCQCECICTQISFSYHPLCFRSRFGYCAWCYVVGYRSDRFYNPTTCILVSCLIPCIFLTILIVSNSYNTVQLISFIISICIYFRISIRDIPQFAQQILNRIDIVAT